MTTTTHQFLNKYPIDKFSEKLIVGTIHPHDSANFKIPYFYGNVKSIWEILSKAFPNELSRPLSLEGILSFLTAKKMSVSDTIISCERTNNTALDKALIPIELNKKMIEDIKCSNIKEILFTSGFGKNNAFRLFFVDILGQKITQEIKDNRGIMLDKEIFGRPVKLTILYSPSGSSNVGISKSKVYLMNKEKYKEFKTPIAEFKVDYYREKFEAVDS